MAEQDIFSLLGEDDSKMATDMNDLNPTLGVTPDLQGTSGAATVQQEAPKQQQVTVARNVLTGSDPMLSQGVGAAVASQLTSVQVKQMNTPSNPMWGSAQQKPQTIIVQQAGQPAKLMLSHHDYAISGQKPVKAGQQIIQVQKQTVQSQLQQQQQLQQQKNIQQQLQLSQQQQQQIKQQLQQLQQKQLVIQQQQQLQQVTQPKPTTQGGFQQLQGGQTITLSGLQQKTIQQSPVKVTTPQQQIIRLPVSLAQQVQQQQQQSLHITPSSTVQTVTLQSKLATATSTAGSPRFIITRQPAQAQQGNQPVTLQLQMQDINSLQRNIGKLQTLPGGQVLRIQPAQQQGVQSVLQPQLTLTNVNSNATRVAAVPQPVTTVQQQPAAQQGQRVITLTPQQIQLLLQRSQQGAGGLSLVQQNVSTATTTAASTPGQVVRTIVLPQTSTATSVGQVLRTLVVPQSAGATGTVQTSSTAGVATQNLNMLASQAAGANSAAQLLQRIVVPQSVAGSTTQAVKPTVVTTKAPSTAGQVVRTIVLPQTSTITLTTQAAPKAVGSTVNTSGLTSLAASGLTSLAASGLTSLAATGLTSLSASGLTSLSASGLTSLPVSTQVVTLPTASTQLVNTITSPVSTTAVSTGTLISTQPVAVSSVPHAVAMSSLPQAVAVASVPQAVTTTAPAKQVVSTILSPKPAAIASTAPLQIVRTVTPQTTTATAAAATAIKTTPSTQAAGGKITISAATAQMLAQKGIVLTRTPQGTFVAKIPQSMLLKAAAAQGQGTAAGAKPGTSAQSLLTKPQTATVLQGQSSTATTVQTGTVAKTQAKAKSQPTILSKSKKSAKTTQPTVATSGATPATMPKLVFTVGSQQVQTTSTTATGAEQKPKMVISMKPGVSAAQEVKKIGEELGKLQGQSKTPENLQKLKDLHSKLKQLQLTVQASAVAAKAKAHEASSSRSSEDTDGDSKSPKDEKERKKLIKQRQLQEKANRIVAEAVAKAKASGLKDIPKIMINVNLPEVTDDEIQKPKKEKTKRSKPSKPKPSKPKQPKSPKPPKPPKEKKAPPPPRKKPNFFSAKKLPLAALNKLKKQRKKMMMPGDESEDSEFDETPPPTPDPELNEFIEKRRSTRNTGSKRKKYTEEYDFNITDDSSSSSDEDGTTTKDPKRKKEKKMKAERTTVISKESEDADTNVEIDVETVEPTEQTKFFLDNPDESQANIVEKILARRTVKKPQLPGEAQVGEVEEFFVKFRSYSYLHCEWGTQDKLLKGDPRILQKIRRFRAKQHSSANFLQDLEDEPFNPDYIEVERVIDKAITEDPDNPGQMVTHYLIKWRSLPYEDATWEVPDDVDNERCKMYEKYMKVPPPSERKRVAKGKPGIWEKMAESREYKNENTLREYQLEGVNWLTFSWFNGQNCILADEMGLGKTIQAITFLEEVARQGIIGPFLVIAPLSTIANWQREFETWTDVNCVVYHGSSQSRHMIAEYEMYYKDDRGRIIPDIYKFQVLITTYEIVLADCQELSEIEWRVVIIDEAHRLKNRNCKLLEGLKILDLEHRVLLTGTPLQNNVEELFSLLNFLDPGRFRSSTQFMEDFGDLKSESQVEKLQAILRPMMLRRLKEDVEKNLAPKEETIIEVELTNIQKKYYRAILERNFNFLNKGTNSTANLPNLMNTMMELRKCCNHPFLIQGAEEQIMLDFQDLPEEEMPYRHLKALVQSAGKMVLLDKLLPKLKEGGHKVLIFSQMIRCLDILEDYLIQQKYPFERIDGRVRGNMRQAAIDRFSKPDSDRFVFLLCTRAGGLGINLTAADTCVIFDSDWNPQNDLQAQARCHRIGQDKAVKVYRLITRNSYEREMFDKASMKLGLDKAVLQSMRSGSGGGGDKEQNPNTQPLSKNEIEDLLKRGAYGAIMDDDDASSKFCEEDIDSILQRRTQIIKIEAGVKGSTFAKASFSLSGARHASDIKLDDPDFWEKWAKRADLDVDQMKNRENFIIDAPRQRKQTRRYGNMDDMVNLSSSDSELESAPQPQQPEKPSKKQLQSGWTRLECFRVEKGLLTYGWGRWNDIISTTRFKRRLGEKDIEAISRTMLIYCLLHYKGDENIKSFIWDLVTPSADGTVKDYKNHKGLSAPVPRGRKGRKPKKEEPVVPAILEYDFNNKDQDPETLLTDQGYKNHLKRHCNKVLLRVRLLYYLKQEVIGDLVEQIEMGVNASALAISIPSPEGEPPIAWWNELADRSLMVGVFKHGYERYIAMRNDPMLCFLERCGRPNQSEIAREINDEFNDSQLDVEGTDGLDPGDDLKPSMSGIKDELMDGMDINDKDESMSSFPPSRTNSPGPNKPKPDLNAIMPCEPGKLPFPPAPDLNTRLRRLVATCQRNHKRQQMKLAKRERREHVKKIRFEEQLRQRELRKLEHAQKWSRREEADFYRILAAYGVEIDPATGKYAWGNFKKLAKLEKKYDERMQEYYEHFRVMCLRVCKKENLIPPDWDSKPPTEFTIEEISEERANKCLHRIDLLLKIRNEILPHPDRDRRLKRCRRSMELPEWWEPGKHDRDLIIGTARYGINRTESQLQMINDPELSFQELKEKYPKWHLPASAFFPPPPPKTVKKEKTEKESLAPAADNDGGASTSAQQETSATEVKQEAVDPDTGEGSAPVVASEPIQVKKEPEDEAERLDESRGGSSQSSLSGLENSESFSQEATNLVMSSQENESPQDTPSSSQNHLGASLQDPSGSSLDAFTSSQDVGPLAMDLSQDAIKSEEKMDIKPITNFDGIKNEDDEDDKERTSGDLEGVAHRELCRPPGDLDAMANPDGSQEMKASDIPGMVTSELNAAEFLRWPKDRVIVHRLEQISHCVLKGEWPGRRRHHHHHNDPSGRSQGTHSGEGRGDGIITPAEHNYAGDEGREDTKTILPKKKKRRKRAEIEQERAAQLAVLLGQNPSLGLHPVFSSLMTSLPLAGAQLPANMAAAAMTPLDLSQNPTAAATSSSTSRYHIQDAEFRPGEAAGMHAAMLAAGMDGANLAGVQQVVHKKKKKHKVKAEGEPMDPEAAEKRRKRKQEILEKKRRRKRKQKDKAKEMSDAFNALKDDDHVPVMNPRTGERFIGPAAPMKKQLGAWMKEHPGFELLYPFHAVVSPDGTSVIFPPLPQASNSQSGEPPKKKKKKSQRNPAKLDPAKLTGEEHVDVIDRNTGKKLPSKLTPTLNNLAEWLVHNPAYDVASEWGSIVKAKGFIGEEQYDRVSFMSMKPTLPPPATSVGANIAQAITTPHASVGASMAQAIATSQAAGILASGLPGSKFSMQIGQGTLGGLGLSAFPSLAMAQQPLGNDAAAIAAAAQQLVNMQATTATTAPHPIIKQPPVKKPKTQNKKKKLKTSHVVSKPIEQTPVINTPPVSGVPSLAGISPYLLPTQGGVFYSPFLASHNVQGLISATTTGTTASSTNSFDNESQSSVDSKFNRTEQGDTEEEQNSVAMSDGALGNFTDDNDSTFAGVDLGDLDGELGDGVITDMAMEEGEAE